MQGFFSLSWGSVNICPQVKIKTKKKPCWALPGLSHVIYWISHYICSFSFIQVKERERRKQRLAGLISMSKYQSRSVNRRSKSESFTVAAVCSWEHHVLPLVLLRWIIAFTFCCQSNVSPLGLTYKA